MRTIKITTDDGTEYTVIETFTKGGKTFAECTREMLDYYINFEPKTRG